MTQIAVVDCGMGNLFSVAKGFARAAPKASVRIAQRAADIAAADRVVLPGDGALAAFMDEMDKRGLREAVLDAAAQKPFLGICVGMQALYEKSEEGGCGLNLFPAPMRRLPAAGEIKVPHIGWNQLKQTMAHPCWAGVKDGASFYFIHSYAAPADAPNTAGVAAHGAPFAAAAAKDNLFAAQFHPEKSRAPGLRLLANFAAWRV